jgi:hypothetical protein
VDSTYKGHWVADYKPGTQWLETPDDDEGMSYVIPLHLRDALMTFKISMPTEEDLAMLPIVNITPSGVWVPSDFNDTDRGLSFSNPIFDPISLAQTATQEDSADALLEACLTATQDQGLLTKAKSEFYDAHKDVTPAGNPAPEESNFHDTTGDLNQGDELHFFDPSDETESYNFPGKAFHLSINDDKVIDSTTIDSFLSQLDHAKLRGDHEEFDSFAYVSRAVIQDQAETVC